MSMQFPPHAIALLFTSGLAAAIALVAWQRRATPGGTSFALLAVALAEWSLLSAFEKAVPGLAAKVLCAKIEYLGVTSVAPLWLLFALGYSQQKEWLTRRTVWLLWIMPVITMVLAATNESHRLVWSSIAPASDSDRAFFIYRHGPWFWIFAAYNYAVILLGTLALARALLRFPHVYRRQAIVLLIALAFPWVGNAIYLAGWSPIPGLDPTPFAFTLTVVVCAWGMFQFQLFDLVPVARDAVIESMGDGVVVLDAQDRIADINPAAQRMVGMTQALPIGQHIGTVLRAWPEVVTHVGMAAESQTEIRLDRDAALYLDVRVTALRDQQGQVTGRLILLRDITERKLLDDLRDDLTHGLVHDLRNPLAGISGSLQILIEDGRSSTQREMLQIARANAQRMLGLVDSILDVSRLESGQLPLERQSVHLVALVAETLQLQQPLAGEKQLHLENAVAEDLPAVLVDPRLTVRVLHNLIDNAIKFTPLGGTIRISARQTGAPPQLAVSVSDTGPGIPSVLQERVFQKYVAGRGTGHGSGLGLAFCRLTVEAHGGRIWVDGDGAPGTTVTFTLPLAA